MILFTAVDNTSFRIENIPSLLIYLNFYLFIYCIRLRCTSCELFTTIESYHHHYYHQHHHYYYYYYYYYYIRVPGNIVRNVNFAEI